jgi:predicted polyphosphate/ATP-dependent NAD kinase
MDALGLENTLLGVDLVRNGELLASDCSARELERLTADQPVQIVITLIGGQGHIIGRGNQQLSPELLRRASLYVVATKTKLNALDGRPLIVDSGDPELDASLAGLVQVHTGYRDAVLYPVAEPANQ